MTRRAHLRRSIRARTASAFRRQKDSGAASVGFGPSVIVGFQGPDSGRRGAPGRFSRGAHVRPSRLRLLTRRGRESGRVTFSSPAMSTRACTPTRAPRPMQACAVAPRLRLFARGGCRSSAASTVFNCRRMGVDALNCSEVWLGKFCNLDCLQGG